MQDIQPITRLTVLGRGYRSVMSFIIAFLLFLSFVNGACIRLLPYGGLQQSPGALIGSDAYRQVRHAQQIVENGALPDIDPLRSAPLGKSNADQYVLHPYLLAISFQILHPVLPNLTVRDVAVFYPVICFVFIGLLFFALARLVVGSEAGVFAVAIFAISPSLIPRTAIGFADRDSLTLLLYLATIFLWMLALRHSHPRLFFPI